MSHNSILVGLALASVPGIAAAQEFQEVFSSGGCSLTVSGSEVVFSGCNITINNGDGQTATANGLGNLIIGDNLSTREDDRSGSHNLVIGDEHSYSARNGLIAGTNHKVRRNNGVAVGGRGNKVTAAHASVFGGQFLQADENKGTVVGDNSAAIDGLTAEVARLDESFASLYASNRAQDSDIDDLLAFTADNAWRLDGIDAVLPGFITPAYLTTNGYITKAALDGYARLTDLDGYALLSDLPNLSGYAERSWVESDFVRRNGFVEFAEQLQVAFMPWVEDNSVSDEELTAMKFVNYETLGDYATKEEAAAGGIAGLAEYLFVDPETDSVVFTGANVFIQDGSDDTPCSWTLGGSVPTVFEDCNGRGNLILGYNEGGLDVAGDQHGFDRTGSHNLITGRYHDYTSFGGILGGFANRVDAIESSVLGGQRNVASGAASVVVGGSRNIADGARTTVIGGSNVEAFENDDILPLVGPLDALTEIYEKDVMIVGANLHVMDGTGSTLNPTPTGLGNLIVGYSGSFGPANPATAGIGKHNLVLGASNTYPGSGGFVGGFENTQAAPLGFIGSGQSNRVEGEYAFIGTGESNLVDALAGAVLTGEQNTAVSDFAAIVTGLSNSAWGRGVGILGGYRNGWYLVDVESTGIEPTRGTAGDYSAVVGGAWNNPQGPTTTIVGGRDNTIIWSAQEFSVLVGGRLKAHGDGSGWVSGLDVWEDQIVDLDDRVDEIEDIVFP